jgi:methyl-accepting chemotaxis protein
MKKSCSSTILNPNSFKKTDNYSRGFMTISRKLLIGSLSISAVSVLLSAFIIAFIGFSISKTEIEKQSENQLTSLREVQKKSISSYLEYVKKQMLTYSDSRNIKNATQDFITGFNDFPEQVQIDSKLANFYKNEFGQKYDRRNIDSKLSGRTLFNKTSDKAATLQHYYIADNPSPLGEKDALVALNSESAYDTAHQTYHPEIRKYLQEFAYYDIFIIDAQSGHIVYSVFKELDYATSLLTGPYKNSGLAEVFKNLRHAKNNDAISFSAFKSYTPSYEDPASFIASPIQDESGNTIAVLAFQMPIDEINTLMTFNHDWNDKGLGLSGETYLVSEEFKAQSLSRFLIEDPDNFYSALIDTNIDTSILATIKAKETNIGFQEIKTQGTIAALNGETGFGIFPDYRDVLVLSAYTHIEFEGSRFAIMSEIDETEAHAYVGKSAWSISIAIFLVSGAILSIVFFIAWRFSKELSTRLLAAVGVSNAVAKGEKVTIPPSESNDEISDLMGALDTMQSELIGGFERAALENKFYKTGLDVCATSVMMADKDYNITYMNHAVTTMMTEAENDLKVELPDFNAQDLLGKSIDTFHKKPAHQRGLLDGLTTTYNGRIKSGARTFDLTATPIFSDDNERLGTIVEWDDITVSLAKEIADKRIADDNAGIKLALDVCSTNVMMADADFNINYMNQSVLQMMSIAEADLRAVLPNFDAKNLIGKNIDVFHKNPAHQRSMLGRLKNVYRTEINVGARTFSLIATPIFNEANDRLGTVVEWGDRTEEVAIESEMDKLISAANEGNLSNRLELEGKVGFFKNISKGLNTLLDSTEIFVEDIGNTFEAMSQGDLTQTITRDYQGEFNRIKNNANSSVNKLADILVKIQDASRTVAVSADEVSQGSDDLSRRTESQASSLEETAASMEEITATVKQTTNNSNQSTTMAADAKSKAELGGGVVQNAVIAMAEILQSSNKINDIIGVIDEIAFQTNLLALNAAVEAARAGEQGRGFAVVAAEVRSLSQRSASAAKEIKDLIRDSVNKVESGSSLVNQSGEVLSEIVDAVEKVSSMIDAVNIASMEQSNGITQINQAIASMDEMTQQNAALVEETSATSRSMTEQAKSMNQLISFFKISGSGATQAITSNESIVHYKTQSAKPSASGSDPWEDF